jgi:hypothetical protein
MDQDKELPDLLRPDTVVPVVEREDTSAQRWALQTRAYSTAGRVKASSPESPPV